MNISDEKKNAIKNSIEKLIEKGIKDKQEIYSKIVMEFGIARPDVRRIARDLRNEMMNKVKILQSDMRHDERFVV